MSGPARRPDRRVLVVSGGLAIAAGIGAILVPALASVATAVFIGCGLLVAAVAVAIATLSVDGLGRKVLRGLVAATTFFAGLYLLISPLEGTFSLTVILVIWFAVMGVTRIAAGVLDLGSPGAGYTIVSGVMSLLLGLLVGVELPSSADWAIGLLVGIDFIFYGLLCLQQAWFSE